MVKFRFSLQSVLEHREHLEREAQIVLGRRQALLREREEARDSLQQEILDLPRREREALDQHGQANARLRLDFVQWAQTLQVRLARARQEVEEQSVEVEKARKALVLRTRERRVMEILREKAMVEFHKELRKDEGKLLDEQGQNLHRRKESSHG